MSSFDVVVIGAGHNGLVCALFLAKAGLSVCVLEDKPVLGGAVRTEYPFPFAPKLGVSTGAYLLGLMPPELEQRMGIKLPTRRRDPHYFLPTLSGKHVFMGADHAVTRKNIEEAFSPADYAAHEAMQAELADFREDVAPTWLREPMSIEGTAERYVRPARRQAFIDLCRGSVGAYLDRWGFKSDLFKAMYATTDGFSGCYGTWDTPGTGMNFLVHNMCRLPEGDGTWLIVDGGMGTVTQLIAQEALRAGVQIQTKKSVQKVLLEGNAIKGVVCADGTEVKAGVVVCNADPFRMRGLIGSANLPAEYNTRLDGYQRDGSTLKINLALSALPKFKCLPDGVGPGGATVHLLPEEDKVIATLKSSFADVQDGRLPEFPTIEWYVHTAVDPSLQDPEGRHSSALFVQWVPYEITGTTWAEQEGRYVDHLLSICDRFAPGTSDLVVDQFVLNPQRIESHFGITRGHIHHVDNAFGFSDRLPYRTPIAGLYSCSAGCHPAGAVIGAAGHNAAACVIRDMEARLEMTEIGRR